MTKENSIRFSLPILAILLLGFTPYATQAQKKVSFTGMLEYKITARDTSLRSILPDNSMFLYTNDTITRMENFTGQLGKQVTIRHIEKNKSYLLIETPAGKFAIKTDLNVADTAKRERKYTFKKKFWKRKVLGMKANRMMVSHPGFEEPTEFLYLKKRSNAYLNNFEEIPGLLVRYSVVTVDGILDYELVKLSEYTPNKDLFGIPSDYEKVTIDEFMDRVLGSENDIPEEN
ncbi:MAG: hypothetical protein JKY09_06690 [Crocinitomicaceae bacterium]|nr:hypothetical protein [Crocinitomicaceae bacterium]